MVRKVAEFGRFENDFPDEINRYQTFETADQYTQIHSYPSALPLQPRKGRF